MPIAGCVLLQREAAGAWLGAAVTLTCASLVQGCDQEPRCGACMKSVTVCVRVAPGGVVLPWGFCHGAFPCPSWACRQKVPGTGCHAAVQFSCCRPVMLPKQDVMVKKQLFGSTLVSLTIASNCLTRDTSC